MKKKILGIVIFLLGICAPYALAKASVAPLQFTGVSSDLQQDRWDSLMKYKIWGTEYISIRENVSISDSIGYNGTTGDLTFENQLHHLGGPTVVGGNMTYTNGSYDTLSAGPVRVMGNLRISNQDNNSMQGDWCV